VRRPRGALRPPRLPRPAALRRLLAVPAPDILALALKIELAVADQAWELTGADTFLPALAADARRLCLPA
jgi:hypothetical protein